MPAEVHRDDPAYDEARDRVTWNKRLADQRFPEGIVSVRSAQDVVDTIRFAAGRGLKVSPRGSGHHYNAAALRDGGLMLDLAALDSVNIDPEARRARVGAGVTGGVLIEQLAAQGLAFPVGHCADVALSGYVLAGGFGWNAGQWGSACGNVSAIEMVTAAGELIVASESEHGDLFWAACGGGPGFFAAITAYHLQLHPLPPVAAAWSVSFSVECAPALAGWLSAATAAAHPAAEIVVLVGTDAHSKRPTITVRAIATGDDENDARARIASFHSPPAEPIEPPSEETLPFAALGKFSAMPGGKRVAADHAWSDAPMGDLLVALYPLADAPSPLSTINLVSFGGDGAIPSRPHGRHGALSVGGGAGAGIYAMWDDPADDAVNLAWVREVDEALAPFRAGRYVGEADLTAGPERLAECYTPEALARLRDLRRQHDPEGLFFAWP